jgi:hypothetical protein
VSTVFFDTAGLIAIWNESDQWHALAQPVYAEMRRLRTKAVTTRYVLLECGNTAARQAMRDDVVRLRIRLTKSNRLIDPTDDDWDQAWEAYARGDAGGAGIVDQVSFVVMRRLGIRQAFTNDEHFRAAGFETLF